MGAKNCVNAKDLSIVFCISWKRPSKRPTLTTKVWRTVFVCCETCRTARKKSRIPITTRSNCWSATRERARRGREPSPTVIIWAASGPARPSAKTLLRRRRLTLVALVERAPSRVWTCCGNPRSSSLTWISCPTVQIPKRLRLQPAPFKTCRLVTGSPV